LKKLLLLILIAHLSHAVFAQRPAQKPTAEQAPLPVREVSGIVKDSTNEVVAGATVKLKTAKDSVSTTTNADGVYIFKSVTSATFVVTVTNIGYRTLVKKMLNNDALPRLMLDPLVIRPQSNQLNEVIINGTPSITYKTDTVEYRASDYKVRANSTVDELLKKMEGMEVGSDGSVTHQGQQVVKARVNGKLYSGGDVAQAIQNLPADIIDKIQVVDDYGDQAARTGIKDGDPQKILNITTRADRSVGNLARISAGAGSAKRYESRIFLQRLDGNQQIGFIGRFNNTVNGVASTNTGGGSVGGFGGNSPNGGTGLNNSAGGSGGTTKSGSPSFSYRDQFGKKIEINASYRYGYRNVNSVNISDGSQLYKNRDTTIQNFIPTTIYFNENSERNNNNRNHNFDLELEYSIDSANYLKFTPTFSLSASEAINQSNRFETGREDNQRTVGLNSSKNSTPNLGAILFYQHIFKKPRRNVSLQLSYTNTNEEQDNEQNVNILYYQGTTDVVGLDSLVHRYIMRDNLNKNLRSSLTYVEPITASSQIEFNAQINKRQYDNNALTNNIDANGAQTVVDSLSNIFNYAFTETRIATNYRLNKSKFNLSLGLTAVPTSLQGSKLNLQQNVSTDKNYFNLIPIARFQYSWSRQHKVSVNYSGSPTEPTFRQIQPVRDVSNAQNPVVGNPDLKPAFRHSVNLQYNNYIISSKLNFSVNATGSSFSNQITSNNVPIPDVILRRNTVGGVDTIRSTKNETRFVNLNGTYRLNGNYNIAKQLAERKYNLSLNGNITYDHNASMLDNIVSFYDTWRFNQRFGPRINPTEAVEINPYISYNITRTFYQTRPDQNRDIRATAIAIDGQFHFMKNDSFTFGYYASKNFVTGIPNYISRNPLVINAYIEKEFFARRALTLNFQLFDLFKQNNFINQETTANSVTNTQTNALSRYFMLSLRANLQKWTGSAKRNGKPMRRRGDGSFMP